MTAKLLFFRRPDDGSPQSLAIMPEDFEFDIRRLRQSQYRRNHPGAIEAGKRFHRIFQGPFHTYFNLERQRTHENLIRLLIGQRLAENRQDAERFISDIIGAEIYLDESYRIYCTLERIPKRNAYRLWYISY